MVDAGAGAAAARPNASRHRHRHRHRSASASAVLSPSKPNNSNANADQAAAAAPKARAKTVASRYLTPSSGKTTSTSSISTSSSASSSSSTSSTTSSRRSASPALRRPASAAERSRPVPPPADAAAASGSAATTRTLSVAFQSPSYSLDTSKARPVPPAAVTAITPEKRRSSAVRWPASANAALCGFHGGALTKSLDCGSNKKEPAAVLAAVRLLAFRETPRRASVDGAEHLQALSSNTERASPAASQDGSGAGIASGARPSPRSIMSSSARFSRDAVGSRSDRFTDKATPFLSRTSVVASSSPTTAPVKKKSLFNGLLSSPFSRPSLRKPSPSKPAASSLRRTASPSPVTSSPGVPGLAVKMQGKGSTDCNLEGDMRRKASGVSKAEDEHLLRVLYNRHLQWRRANAQAGAALSSQTRAAEKYLCGAWIAILGMHKSVALRKFQLQLLRNNCKLMAILRGQMIHLEEWSLLEKKYAKSLSGTAEALNATILRLPVCDGAMADIQSVKNAVGSAIDVMQTIGNSISTLLSKLARTNVLVSQLSRIAIQEHVLMAQCRELMSTLASMHVKYCSLQGQRVQLSS